uniref:Uncharacterized protein n=1 Tax=Knipowitschia caucasica TaxID=637954 RepID=A0AAV2J1J4_KNICA
MMELTIQLIPTGEIILAPGKNGENYCHNCKECGGRRRLSLSELPFRFVSNSAPSTGYQLPVRQQCPSTSRKSLSH